MEAKPLVGHVRHLQIVINCGLLEGGGSVLVGRGRVLLAALAGAVSLAHGTLGVVWCARSLTARNRVADTHDVLVMNHARVRDVHFLEGFVEGRIADARTA